MNCINFYNNLPNEEVQRRIHSTVAALKTQGNTEDKIKQIFKESVFSYFKSFFSPKIADPALAEEVEWLHKNYCNNSLDSSYTKKMEEIFQNALKTPVLNKPAPAQTAPILVAPAAADPVQQNPLMVIPEVMKTTSLKEAEAILFNNFAGKAVTESWGLVRPGEKGVLPEGTKSKVVCNQGWLLINQNCQGTEVTMTTGSFIGVDSDNIELRLIRKNVIFVKDHYNVKIRGEDNVIVLLGYARVDMSPEDQMKNTIIKVDSYSSHPDYDKPCSEVLGKMSIPSSSKLPMVICHDKKEITIGSYSDVTLGQAKDALIKVESSCTVKIFEANNCKIHVEYCKELFVIGSNNEIFLGSGCYNVKIIHNGGRNTIHNSGYNKITEETRA